MIYTLGHEQAYDAGLALYGQNWKKLGRGDDYCGGSVFQTPADAATHLTTAKMEDAAASELAVYEVDAVWGVDTAPADNGDPWHDLLRDAVITRKVILNPTFDQYIGSLTDAQRHGMLVAAIKRLIECEEVYFRQAEYQDRQDPGLYWESTGDSLLGD